eukprot:CAMPEP_0170084850 /NCGR_PEP_ID=MMETSP0019_2-20121128/19912_1 /TAXON_ID=98059 /ORGANISM="Dinobryon sp., Strain UTEXLB2267" /LENGTH=59 /DNA_ID=CAMNT_0010301081 /DNA_START=129 /DNA_END=308 /DNA_ORIENTATION=+
MRCFEVQCGHMVTTTPVVYASLDIVLALRVSQILHVNININLSPPVFTPGTSFKLHWDL